MSNPEDNTDNQKLRELLNKTSQKESLDDFEQDALEGFAMLENEKDALDLKNKLDVKMYSEVFTEEKKSRNYWYAAAGLFLVIGFSIYFFRNSSLVKKEEKLALQTEHVMSADEIQKSINAQTEKNRDLEFKSARNNEPKADSAKQSEQEVAVNSAPVKKPKAIDNTLTAPTEFKPEPVAVSQAAPMAYHGESKILDNVAVGSDKNVSADKEGENDVKLQEEQFTESTVAQSKKEDREVAAMEVKKSKASERKKESPGNYSSPAPSSGAIALPITPSVVNEIALQKELKENLKAKNLLEKFDATLMINQKGKVEQIIFTNAFSLTKTQQKEVSEIIKQLKTLTFKANSQSVLSEYMLVFRP